MSASRTLASCVRESIKSPAPARNRAPSQSLVLPLTLSAPLVTRDLLGLFQDPPLLICFRSPFVGEAVEREKPYKPDAKGICVARRISTHLIERHPRGKSRSASTPAAAGETTISERKKNQEKLKSDNAESHLRCLARVFGRPQRET